jgi:hypothetical protein
VNKGEKSGSGNVLKIFISRVVTMSRISPSAILLNDKKELMHDNQLLKISQFVNSKGIQSEASILKDKLPEELNREEFFW